MLSSLSVYKTLHSLPCICKSKSVSALLEVPPHPPRPVSVSLSSVTGLRCILMFPNTAHERGCSKIHCLRLLAHVSAGKRLWSQLWIWPLHTDYFKALIIHQGRREAKKESVKKSLLVSISLPPWLPRSPSLSLSSALYTQPHWICWARFGPGPLLLYCRSIKQCIIFLQPELMTDVTVTCFARFIKPLMAKWLANRRKSTFCKVTEIVFFKPAFSSSNCAQSNYLVL